MPHPAQSPGRDRSGYLNEDTIAAIATATGGALAIVRISGKGSFEALRALGGEEAATPREVRRVRILDPKSRSELDDALFVRFVGPASFTGEDVVELHLHGSPYVATRVMESLESIGVRQALPGEFSFRAVRNGKLSLTQAQAVADLIASSNEGAMQLALEKLSGTQNRLISDLALRIRKLNVMGELGIDFSDQDVDEVSLPALKRDANRILETLARLEESYERGVRLQDGISAAFVGPPNAGKSSFFNALLGEERSIVSDIAGTTRDVVRERLTLRGKKTSVTLRLEDTAGLRVSDNPIEKIGIERAEKSARQSDLVLFLVDCSNPIDAPLEQWHRLSVSKERTIGILTKIDLIPSGARPTILRALEPFGIERWVETSAQTSEGISDAVEAITELGSKLIRREPGEVLLTQLNQVRAVQDTRKHLERALSTTEVDLFASDARQALHSLAPLIGETPMDEILGQIFTDFCIGK